MELYIFAIRSNDGSLEDSMATDTSWHAQISVQLTLLKFILPAVLETNPTETNSVGKHFCYFQKILT